jgi:hypothetical protein
MRISKKLITTFIFIPVLFLSFNPKKNTIRPYKIPNEALYETIVAKDKEFFDAYKVI